MTYPILVVGGAGYIGSHMVRCLQRAGLTPVVLDNLVCGYASSVQGGAELIVGDIGDAAFLDQLFSSRQFGGVMHFASYIQVGESVSDPAKYYDNNVARTITLLNAMVKHKVQHFIFSSTAATFGNPEYVPIDEKHPTNPINPYGRSKLMVEQLLEDYHAAYGLRFGCLRYFNAAGAETDGTIGECHEPETHLIPLVLQVASGRRAHIKVFGNDYPTPDGTCIRDYIHVSDLAEAHLLLLRSLQGGMNTARFNLGTGTGYSVMEVIDTSRQVTGCEIVVQIEARRAGDPASLIADGSAARTLLGWTPTLSDLSTIISHAWNWEKRLNAGKIT
jgi:UDP-glucose 4-epimerase